MEIQDSRCPDLILLDFMIGSGFSDKIINPIQNLFGRENVRIIIITAHASHPRLKDLAHTIPVIDKPLSQTNLNKIVGLIESGGPVTPAHFN